MIIEKRQVEYEGEVFSLAVKYVEVSDNWLVFMHGIGCAKECFDYVFQTELTKHFSILTFDFLGFGDSDKPDTFRYSLEQHAAITKKLIEQFHPTKVSLIAHSMGGTIAVLLAQQLDNLTSLINLEGNLGSSDSGIVSRWTAKQAESVFVEQGFNEFLGKLRGSEDKSFRTWADWYAKSSRLAIHRSGTSLVEWSDSGRLMSLFNQIPRKAYIHGDKTGISHIQPQFKNVEQISISDSGHFMMLDNPEEFYAALTVYLDSEAV